MIVSTLVDHLPDPHQPGEPDPHPNGHYGHEPHPPLPRARPSRPNHRCDYDNLRTGMRTLFHHLAIESAA